MYKSAIVLIFISTLLTPSTGYGQNASTEGEFVRLKDFSSQFVYDMKYATNDNFLNKKVYECSDCVMRKKVANALIKANAYFMKKGYRIKLYDCYRPLDVQKAMWELFPKPGYVANPKTGSIHNRGGAVDITLVGMDGKKLDMGTKFDHFGKEAHHSYTELPKSVLANRKLLKEGMALFGFKSIRTEWWHYNYKGASEFRVSNFKVECNN